MANPATPFRHSDFEKKDDSALKDEALAHLGKSPSLQLMGELLTKLRALALPWWTPAQLRGTWSATNRMSWFSERVGLRQRITTRLTGLPPNAAKKKAAEFQGALIDSVLDEGDVTVADFENTFDPFDVVVYGPAAEHWHAFRAKMPWTEDSKVHQELIAWLLKALLSDSGDLTGCEGEVPPRKRSPILTPWDVRTAINGRVWHTHMPVEIRVAIDEARFKREKEKPRDPFQARDDLAIALPEVITANIPLAELREVFSVAEKALRFELAKESTPPPKDDETKDGSPPSASGEGGAKAAGEGEPEGPVKRQTIRTAVVPPGPGSELPPNMASAPPAEHVSKVSWSIEAKSETGHKSAK